jgi:hypothetical protein
MGTLIGRSPRPEAGRIQAVVVAAADQAAAIHRRVPDGQTAQTPPLQWRWAAQTPQ